MYIVHNYTIHRLHISSVTVLVILLVLVFVSLLVSITQYQYFESGKDEQMCNFVFTGLYQYDLMF